MTDFILDGKDLIIHLINGLIQIRNSNNDIL